MQLNRVAATIDRLRVSLGAYLDPDEVHTFVQTVNDLGYHDPRTLRNAGLDHAELTQAAISYLQRYLKTAPSDSSALNNLGVLLSNTGNLAEPRCYIEAALELAPNDRNVHENLRILDILSGKAKATWHDIPTNAQKADRTLVAYFDPHGM